MRGFTLLETLVAVAILGLGITSVLQLIGAAAANGSRAQVTTEALFAAEDLMEDLASLDESELRKRDRHQGSYDETLRTGPRAGLVRREAQGGYPAFAYLLNVTGEHAEPGLYRVDVQVSWTNPRPGSIELTTLRRFAPAEAEDSAW
ncbi:MAG: prepilin-type N-terminal cleavage/methylation domain-containing protein [Gemmatimonadetes bacterium]|nr:prepilin-type N-terminal cleavage/methylation domain-containing protein [Gemmatimonadota bacterium]